MTGQRKFDPYKYDLTRMEGDANDLYERVLKNRDKSSRMDEIIYHMEEIMWNLERLRDNEASR